MRYNNKQGDGDLLESSYHNRASRTKVSRRTALATLGSIGAVALSGCASISGSSGNSGKPDFIRYLGWGGNTQDSARKLFKQWSKKSGIEVKHQSAGGDSEIISIMKQNPGKIDFANLTSFGLLLGRSNDLLAEIDYSSVPNYTKNMQKSFQNVPYLKGHSDALFRDPVTQGFTVNKNKVSKEKSSWTDLLDDSFNKNLSLRDHALSRFSNAALATGSNINKIQKDDQAYKNALAHLKKVNKNVVKYWSSGAQAIQLLREKNVLAAEMWGGRTLALKEAGYDQMEYIIPKEGSFVLDENYGITKSSEKQDAVLNLLNWSYKRENAVELTKNLGYPVMITNPPQAITKLPDYVDSIDQLSWPKWEVVRPNLTKMQQDFQSIKQ